MDKQKQIRDKLIKVIKKQCICCNGNDCDKCCYDGDDCVEERLADAILDSNAIITENAVVLTRERYEELEKAVDSVQVAVSSFTRLETLYKIKCKQLEIAEEKTRKETAEKFAERLKEALENRSSIAGYDLEDLEFDGEIIQECIDEIAKEFTEGSDGK